MKARWKHGRGVDKIGVDSGGPVVRNFDVAEDYDRAVEFEEVFLCSDVGFSGLVIDEVTEMGKVEKEKVDLLLI